MDPVGLYHSKCSISLVSFSQPSRWCENGSSHASGLVRPLDSLGWLWPMMVVGQKKRLAYPSYQSLVGRSS